jgi:hypothetical protein
MNLPRGNFVNVSGVDVTDGATVVFVWCRDKGPEVCTLLGSGHVVGAIGFARPPGISIGQFSVTFLLPLGCSIEDVFVTDDKNGKDHLPGVTVTPCVNVSGVQPANIVPPTNAPVLHADYTQSPSQSGRVLTSSQRI